ncbi:hypothetical protein DFR74_113147 [Nocardia puris]|uniref:Alanine, arginine and proline rich protein n=1 Tax=Nocardia puris TaxID=208602 RepID=A0A366DAZ5_9NOCA|nr:hypothetical protein DFR74_113147 [Nocardia puris]
MSGCDEVFSAVPRNEPPLGEPPRRMRSRGASRIGDGLRIALRESHGPERDREDAAAAHTFAVQALRLLLEVLDRRRPPAQLATVAEPAVVAAVRTLAASEPEARRKLGTAVLVRVDAIPVDDRIAEICAGYERGHRRFALAARVVRTGRKWRLTAVRVG